MAASGRDGGRPGTPGHPGRGADPAGGGHGDPEPAATYLRLDEHLGGIAPGRCADIQVLADFGGRPPEAVVAGGRVMAESGLLTQPWSAWRWQDHLTLGHQVDLAVAGDPAAYQPPVGPGGIAVAAGTTVLASLELDIAGLMSSRPLADVAEQWAAAEREVKKAGCPFAELLYCLCFITCDFLPDLRLVADGLLEVKTGRILTPAIQL